MFDIFQTVISAQKHNHGIHESVMGGSSMIGFPLVIADSERDMPGIEPGPLDWHTRALTNELQEVIVR